MIRSLRQMRLSGEGVMSYIEMCRLEAAERSAAEWAAESAAAAQVAGTAREGLEH